ncbi:CHASE2 domain-containing sensor protein [Herbaspirillum sp. Sphag1AN]|nr:CHASE2 domain-containing protein [Herbaspirillum sp. Sphag1AN]MBB3212919.1 CHASE2 domain-containing sensor protein [Herbaspirillum sp. Sphag1AN]MBB3246116.1 CHASE2 domain-containing sensor protein [Herbaspirillum sp. Sphag64]
MRWWEMASDNAEKVVRMMAEGRQLFHALVRRLAMLDGRVFHIALAVLLGVGIVLSYGLHQEQHMKGSIYDWMTRHRFHTPQPDPEVVILDIDEKSLALLSSEFGLWPWPRDVLGAVLAELEAQQAQAVVFDILFSDPDKKNPVSEQAFSDVIASSKRSFFSVLRLNPDNDDKSQIRASDMPGLIQPQPGESPSPARTFALVPPYFATAVATGRLGTLNIQPDSDGVIRRYHLWEDIDGWRIPSLPQRLANDLGWPQQAHENQLLQWMDKPLAHRRISFADLYQDSQKKNKRRPRDEFKGKIVVIGATAASLFDVKGSPLSFVHPGVDVLATAIDNLKNQQFLREIPVWVQLPVVFGLLLLMVCLSLHYSREQLEFAFLVAPAILLLIAYLSMNTLYTFVDLSMSASVALIYFTVAKLYSVLMRQYWSGEAPFGIKMDAGKTYRVICLAAIMGRPQGVLGLEMRFLRLISRYASHAKGSIGLGKGIGWLQPALNKILIATWVCPVDDAQALDRMHVEATALREKIAEEFASQQLPQPSLLERTMFVDSVATDTEASLRSMILDSVQALTTTHQQDQQASMNDALHHQGS